MSTPIEVPLPLAPNIYNGVMDGDVFEVNEPALQVTTNLIRTTQDWGVKVKWEMTGPLAVWLDADFHLSAFLESIGPGPEYAIPDPAAAEPPIVVNTLSSALTFPGGVPTRSYEQDINIPAGKVKPHPYKIVAFMQLFSCCRENHKYPIAGMYELPITDVFEPE